MTATLSESKTETSESTNSNSNRPIYQAVGVEKIYPSSAGEVVALKKMDLTIPRGEFLSIRGASGSGKTTLLMALGGMSHPSSGKILFEGADLYQLNAGQRAQYRAQSIGFIFQMFHLAPYLNILENTLLAWHKQWYQSEEGQKPADRAKEILTQLGLSHRLTHRPSALSAGERQRAAIARALFNRPSAILADEPTGNLDPENAKGVFEALQDFHHQGGTVILVTHGEMGSEFATREIHLS